MLAHVNACEKGTLTDDGSAAGSQWAFVLGADSVQFFQFSSKIFWLKFLLKNIFLNDCKDCYC